MKISLLALSLLIGSTAAFAQTSLRVHTSDAISGDYAASVSVKVTDSNGDHVGVTDEYGVVDFANLAPIGSSEPDEYSVLILETSSGNFLPHRKEVLVAHDSPDAQLSLVPRKFGYTTPVISALRGGTYQLPRLGLLRVKEGALEADARLWLAVVPIHARDLPMVEGQLQFELWCAALDPDGYPQPGTLPLLPGEVILNVSIPSVNDPVEDLESETWTSYGFDESWSPLASVPVATVDNGGDLIINVPIIEGFNLVERDYRTVAQAACRWGPWKIEVVETGRTPVPGGGQEQGIHCGRYTANDCLEVQAGLEQSTSWDAGVETQTEIGMEAGNLMAQVSASVGTTVSGSYGESTVTSTTTRKSRCTTSGNPINGDPAPTLTPPWGCVSGTMDISTSFTHYKIFAKRRKVVPGAILRETKVVGNMDLPGKIINVWNVSIDTTCPGCDADPPPELPGPLPK